MCVRFLVTRSVKTAFKKKFGSEFNMRTGRKFLTAFVSLEKCRELEEKLVQIMPPKITKRRKSEYRPIYSSPKRQCAVENVFFPQEERVISPSHLENDFDFAPNMQTENEQIENSECDVQSQCAGATAFPPQEERVISPCHLGNDLDFESNMQTETGLLENSECDISSSSSSVHQPIESCPQNVPRNDVFEEPNDDSNSDDPVIQGINKLRAILARRHSFSIRGNLLEKVAETASTSSSSVIPKSNSHL